MATLREIRDRIGSIKNTEKITRAMKMIASVKFRKAQQSARHIVAQGVIHRAILRLRERLRSRLNGGGLPEELLEQECRGSVDEMRLAGRAVVNDAEVVPVGPDTVRGVGAPPFRLRRRCS